MTEHFWDGRQVKRLNVDPSRSGGGALTGERALGTRHIVAFGINLTGVDRPLAGKTGA